MRFVATLLMWLVTTILLAVALPAAWAQQHLVDSDGYAALAQQAASNPALQSAMAAELSTQVVRTRVQRRLECGEWCRSHVYRRFGIPRPVRASQPVRASMVVRRCDPIRN